MNDIFSFKRFAKVLRADFQLMKCGILVYLCLLIVAILMISLIISKISSNSFLQLYIYNVVSIVPIWILASLTFGNINDKGSRILYLTLPASNIEKFLSRLTVFVLIPAAIMLIFVFLNYDFFKYYVFTFGRVETADWMNYYTDSYNSTTLYLKAAFLITMSIAPIMMLGSLLFNQYVFVKIGTIYVALLLICVIGFDYEIELSYTEGNVFENSNMDGNLKPISLQECDFCFKNVIPASVIAVTALVASYILFVKKNIIGYTKSENYGF